MSTDVYAGQLCATHVNEWVQHPELDNDLKWWIAEIRHSERHPTVLVVAKGVDYQSMANRRTGLPKKVVTLRLQPDEIVTFSVR